MEWLSIGDVMVAVTASLGISSSGDNCLLISFIRLKAASPPPPLLQGLVPTRFVQKYTPRHAQLELGGVDLDLAVEDDVVPLDRADMRQQVGVEREVRSGGNR